MFVVHASSGDDRLLLRKIVCIVRKNDIQRFDETVVDDQESTVPIAELQDAYPLADVEVSIIHGQRTMSIKYIHVSVQLYIFHMYVLTCNFNVGLEVFITVLIFS